MANSIDTSDDVIDSRDVIERIEELKDELSDLEDLDLEDPDDLKKLIDMDVDTAEELRKLLLLQDGAKGYAPDWLHGATLIRESHFVKYAQELADEMGAVPKDGAWPVCHIDWDAAAEALKVDYTTVDFDGVDYLVR